MPPSSRQQPAFDALSEGSDLTGTSASEAESDAEVMPRRGKTASSRAVPEASTPNKRRRLVRAAAPKAPLADDDDDDIDEEDEEEIPTPDEDDNGGDDGEADNSDDEVDASLLDDGEDEDTFGDELDDDDAEFGASSSKKRGSGKKSSSAAPASTPKRGSRASARASAATAPSPANATPASTKRILKVKLNRTPAKADTQSIPAESDVVSPVASKKGPGRPRKGGMPSASGAATTSTSASKLKWKPNKGDDSGDEIPTPALDDADLDDLEDMDESRLPTSGSDAGSDSEPDEATAAEMASIVNKTARQLARETDGGDDSLMELPMFDPNRKKKLTENEIALRRSETARKRKNQTEKKLEDDKIETINRLLKKQVGRSRNKLRAGSADAESDEEAEKARLKGKEEVSRKQLKELPAPFFRYIDRGQGSILAVPSGPRLVDELWGPNYVTVNQAIIEDLDKPIAADLEDKEKKLAEKAKARLQAQKAEWDDEQELESIWGQEGLYEYKLRKALGQSRKQWIADRPRPVQPEEEKADEEDAEEPAQEAEADAEAEQHDGIDMQVDPHSDAEDE